MIMPTNTAIESTTTTTKAMSMMSTATTTTARINGSVSDEGGGTILLGGPQNGREARNLAEKHRRDKLNASIQELSTMVPHVAEATRRLDKTAVLRFAAHGLRLEYVFGKSTTYKQNEGGDFMNLSSTAPTSEQIAVPPAADALMRLLDSFFITLTCHGQIVLVSASVEQLLGHCQSDLYGQNILHITHPADQELMRRQLIPCDMDTLFRHDYHHTRRRRRRADMEEEEFEDDDEVEEEMEEENDETELQEGHNSTYYARRTPSPCTQKYLADIDRRLRADHRCFTVRLARAGTRSEAQRTYEVVKIDGCFRRSDCSTAAGSFPIVSQLIRRSRNTGNGGLTGGLHTLENDIIAQAALHGVSGNDIVLVALARIMRPTSKIWRLSDPNQLEYRTRHLIDGRIVDCDQRIGLVAGYMREEVHNLSPFSFIHLDDVRWVIVALRQMYDCNSDYGESCYRLITRNGHFIYLQTKGYLDIDKHTNKVHSFLCVNTLLSEEEGRRRVREMKERFSVIVKTKIPSNTLEDVPASQNPQQLERIVLYLIENLQKQHEEDIGSSSNNTTSNNFVSTPAVTSPSTTTQWNDMITKSKTPPLSLVPPTPVSVKKSISKSVSVVNVTAAKNLTRNHRSPSSCQSSDASLSPASSVDQTEETIATIECHRQNTSTTPNDSNSMQSERPSVLRVRVLPTTATTTATPLVEAAYTTNVAKIVQNVPTVIKQLPSTAPSTLAVPPATTSVLPATITVSAVAIEKNSLSTPNIIRTTTSTLLPAVQTLKQHISVLKRLHPQTTQSAAIESDLALDSPAKRPAAVICQKPLSESSPSSPNGGIHTVLSSSLRNLDYSLQTIGQGARALCEQRSRLLPKIVPRNRLDQKLDAIIVEHHKQECMLGHIKNEYSVHMQHKQQQQPSQSQPQSQPQSQQ